MTIPKDQLCESHTGITHDEDGEPVLIPCDKPATVEREQKGLPWPIFLCAECEEGRE